MDNDAEKAFLAYSKISEQIAKEDSRLHERMTWGITLNGGFLVVIVGVLGMFKDDVLKGNKLIISIFICISIIVAFVALWVCYHIYNAILDAKKQIHYIREIYDAKWKTEIEESLGLPRPFGSRVLFTGADGTPRQVTPWWGDNLIRGISFFWIMVIMICVGLIVYVSNKSF